MSTPSLKFPPEKLCKCFRYYPDIEVEETQDSGSNEYVPPWRFCDDVPAGYKSYQFNEKGSSGVGTAFVFRSALEHLSEPQSVYDDYDSHL
jgi:hypothetical protein